MSQEMKPGVVFEVLCCRCCVRDFDARYVRTCPYCNFHVGQCKECGFLEEYGHSLFCESKPVGTCSGCGLKTTGGEGHRLHCMWKAGYDAAYGYEKAVLDAIMKP